MIATAAPRRLFITISVMLASVMQSLDNTIANVSLPHIQGSLSATQDQIAWVLTSYILAAAIMTPLSGWLAGYIGRRKVFLLSIAGFTVASVLCGLAQSLPEMVGARLLQGICGAALVPMSQAVLLDINPPEKHAAAMAMWMVGVIMGPILGPLLGSWLTENYNWRWVFYINLPFGILSILGILTFMPETHFRKTHFDFFGFTTFSVAIASLQLMLDRGQLKDWFDSPEIVAEAMIAGLAFYLFVVHMLTTKRAPFVRPQIFKDRNFLTGSVFIFIVGIILFSTLALLPPMLHDMMRYPIVLTGVVTSPRGVGTLIATLIVSRIANKIDTRFIIAGGFALIAYSLWEMTEFYMQMSMAPIIRSGFLQGLGMGFVYAPLAAVSFATLGSDYRNEGTAMFSLLRNFGSSIGIAVMETFLTRNVQILHLRLAEKIVPYDTGLNAVRPEMFAEPGGLARINDLVTSQAAMVAYLNNFKLMMVLTLCAIPFVALLRTSPSTTQEVIAIE